MSCSGRSSVRRFAPHSLAPQAAIQLEGSKIELSQKNGLQSVWPVDSSQYRVVSTCAMKTYCSTPLNSGFDLQNKPSTIRASTQEKLTKFEMSTVSTLNFVVYRAGCAPACGGGWTPMEAQARLKRAVLPRWRVVAVEDGNLCQAGASREQGIWKGFTSLWHSWESLSAKNPTSVHGICTDVEKPVGYDCSRKTRSSIKPVPNGSRNLDWLKNTHSFVMGFAADGR
ncbi:hypothetical protein FB45DRAFT_1009807 [Roridomyces roridus]|uniref:Uncharacterized protein n=1 Tax=Roridomyces roridus TaxID=1738132 RepID=A0AAD7FBR4_9AGAR|nr:hypothetical protein FB45DRAFT_1009807 [Roridomyces roridus]